MGNLNGDLSLSHPTNTKMSGLTEVLKIRRNLSCPRHLSVATRYVVLAYLLKAMIYGQLFCWLFRISLYLCELLNALTSLLLTIGIELSVGSQ